jgi:hypothetical protein
VDGVIDATEQTNEPSKKVTSSAAANKVGIDWEGERERERDCMRGIRQIEASCVRESYILLSRRLLLLYISITRFWVRQLSVTKLILV